MACHGIACACCDCASVYRRRGLLGNGLVAATALLLAATGPGERVFDTRTAPGYGDPTPGLKTYLGRALRRGRKQHVCVVGYRHDGGDRQVWVHWREGRRLILWDGSDPAYRASRIGWGRRDLDLREDVVATDAEVDSSSYLVTRAWFDRVVADCAAHGTRYKLR